MKNKYLLHIFSLLLLFTGCNKKEPWVEIHSKEGGYSISFPGKPIKRKEPLDMQFGKVTMDANIYTTENVPSDDNLIYAVASAPLQDSVFIIHQNSKQRVLESFIESSIKSVEGELITDRPFEKQSYPGRELAIDFKKGAARMRQQLILVDTSLVALTVITLRDKIANKDIDKFFNSLVIDK